MNNEPPKTKPKQTQSNPILKAARHRMPTLGSGWRSYRVGVLRKFPIPTSLHSQDSQLLRYAADLAAKLLNKKLSKRDRMSTLSSIESIISELYGISKNELQQLPTTHCCAPQESK